MKLKFNADSIRRMKQALGNAYTFAGSLEMGMDDCILPLERLISQINESVREARALQREYKKYLEGEVRRDAQNGIAGIARARTRQ